MTHILDDLTDKMQGQPSQVSEATLMKASGRDSGKLT